ncbi:hypothetical protein [Chryseobacterium taihuense]|uniref:Uncharacterized protein n=1 Tax=Chryseobacterium taihuense TaxID=1141221 RepID=A0ABY0QRL3_9FLAO|nr:hypothetical protein [Chryseobacterium taihuense]SDL62879.1 hypothetical protein SAMN05216273_103205 [Chryseobacterium taihuense]
MTKILKEIRLYLIELARCEEKNTTYYFDLLDKFNLKYNLKIKEDNDKFSKQLAKILKYEIDNQRPCLTVLIVKFNTDKYKINGDKSKIELPSQGFYHFAEKYHRKGIATGREEFFIKEKQNVINFWKDETNYEKYKDFK